MLQRPPLATRLAAERQTLQQQQQQRSSSSTKISPACIKKVEEYEERKVQIEQGLRTLHLDDDVGRRFHGQVSSSFLGGVIDH